MHGDWRAPPYLDHFVAQGKEGLCYKVPFTGSTQVAEIWEVDHSILCGKLLGHRRSKWADANPPRSSTSGAWGPSSTHRSGWHSCPCGQTSPSPTMGPWRTGVSSQACGTQWAGCRDSRRVATPGRRCPPTWTNGLMGGLLGTTAPCVAPSPWRPCQRRPASRTRPVAPAGRTRRSSCPSGPGVARLCNGTWSVAWHGTDRTRLTPTEAPSGRRRQGLRAPSGDFSGPPHGRNSDFRLADQTSGFVDRLRDYGSLQTRSAGSWTSIGPRSSAPSRRRSLPREAERELCSLGPTPTSPIAYGQARELLPAQYGRLPEGRGQEAFGSTLADYIFTEISATAGTCGDGSHYQVVDNGLWYLLGQYAEPAPGAHNGPLLPQNNKDGRNQTGNVYEALVGLYWPEGQIQELVDFLFVLMDLDQIESAWWTPAQRRSSTGSLRGVCALRCSRFAFVWTGRAYGYANGGPSPANRAVAEPRDGWLQKPGQVQHIEEWGEDFVGHMPEGNPLPSSSPPGNPPPGGGSGSAAGPGGAPSSSGDHSSRRCSGFPAPGGDLSDVVQYSRGHAQQGAAPAQEGRHPQAYGALPDFRDKYFISYSEGREVPPPIRGRTLSSSRSSPTAPPSSTATSPLPRTWPTTWRPSESRRQLRDL